MPKISKISYSNRRYKGITILKRLKGLYDCHGVGIIQLQLTIQTTKREVRRKGFANSWRGISLI